MLARFEANTMTPSCRTRASDPLAHAITTGVEVLALLGSCRAHYVPSTTENRGQQTLRSTSKATHKPPAHHTFGLLNTPVDHQPVSDSQAEYAGSIPVIRSRVKAQLIGTFLGCRGSGSCSDSGAIRCNSS